MKGLLSILALISSSTSVAAGWESAYQCGKYRLTVVTGDYNSVPANYEILEIDVNNTSVQVSFTLKTNPVAISSINGIPQDVQCKYIGSRPINGGY